MKNKYFLIALFLPFVLVSQTVKDDLQTLLIAEGIEQIEIEEMLKSRIDREFINYVLSRRTNPKRLILEYIADYTDAALIYDENGWQRLLPQGFYLYHCEVYSYNNKAVFSIPCKNDQIAYNEAEKAFLKVHPEEVVKVIINKINHEKLKP